MKAFITGASGFIGGNLTETLLKNGHQVRCLCRSPEKARFLKEMGADVVIGDLLRPETLIGSTGGCDTVFHVAGVTKALNSAGYFRGNEEATKNLVEIIDQASPTSQKLVYVSSQAAAGPSLSPNFSEDDFLAGPVSAYGKSKLGGERIVNGIKSKCDIVILRPSIVFGPRDREMLPLFKAAVLGIIPHAGLTRDFPVNFIYIDDLVQAIVLAATHEEAIGKTYFVHNGIPSSWKVMNRILAHELNPRAIVLPVVLRILWAICQSSALVSRISKTPAYMNPDKWQEIKQDGWLCSSKKIEKDLGFSAQWKLQHAVATTTKWYRDNGWLR